MEIIVLDDKFIAKAEIDTFSSLIWCERAHDIGALDLEIEASAKNLEIFQIGYFIYRKDTSGICRIDSIEVKTDAEDGDKLIIGATDLKSFAEQVTVHGEFKDETVWVEKENGDKELVVKNVVNVEQWIRETMKVFTVFDSTVLPKNIYPKFEIDNFTLGNANGYTDTAQLLDSKDARLSEHINHLCEMSGFSWKITYDYDRNLLSLNVKKSEDKTIEQEENTRVLFSKTFDNLQSTKLSQSIGKMANVAVIKHNNGDIMGDNGTVFAYLTEEEPYGIYRFDLPVDGTKVAIPHIQTSADFIQVEEGKGDYKLENGEYIKGTGNYLYQPQYTADEITSYRELLKALGLAKLKENRVTQKFESEINFNQFIYRDDYDVGDIVTVQNEYGVQLNAKIIEVVETWDESGYSIEPAFEYIGSGGNFGGFGGFGNFGNFEEWDNTDCIITEDGEPIMTEDDFYLMYEDGTGATVLATEYGIALTAETGLLLAPNNSIATVAELTEYSGAEPVATVSYAVSESDSESVGIETVKISELPEAEGIGNACCLPIVQEGETKKIFFDAIKANICESFEIDENGHLIINV